MAILESRTDDKNFAQNMQTVGFYSWNVQENRVHGDEVIGWVFGISVEELAAGAPIDIVIRLVDDGGKQKLARAVHQAIVNGLPYEADYRLTHPDGRRVHVVANGRCLRDAQGVPSIFSGTVTVQPAGEDAADPLEDHCRAALGLANSRRHALAARYISSALRVLGAKAGL